MSKRLTIIIDDEAAARLLELAGSQRRQGEYIAKMVNAVYENHQAGGTNLAAEDLRLKMLGMVAELGEMRSRVVALERVRLS